MFSEHFAKIVTRFEVSVPWNGILEMEGRSGDFVCLPPTSPVERPLNDLDLASGPHVSGFAPYVALRSLGMGSFGEAILAHHPARPSHLVVLKVPRGRDHAQAAEACRLLENEASLLCTLCHPRIVPFLDYVVNRNGSFIVMAFVAGGSLAEKLRTLPGFRLSAPKVARLLLDVLQALDYMHGMGVLHLDVK